MPKLGSKITVSDGVDFACPFCSAKATVSADNGMVLHAMPVCAKYVSLEAEEYIAAVNDALASTVG